MQRNNMADDKTDFIKLGGDNGFSQRADAIFGKLNTLEPATKPAEVPDKDEDFPKLQRSHGKGRGRGRPPRRVPDHVLHPTKWKKYSLEEDGSHETSLAGDALNKHVALSFIQDLKKRKSVDVNKDEVCMDVDEEAKHVFSKPCVSTEDKDSQSNASPASVGIGRKLIMPEYEVGKAPQRMPSKKKPKLDDSCGDSSSKVVQNALSLQHLASEDEQTNDAGDSAEKVEVKFVKRQVGKSKRSLRKHVDDD